MATSVSRIIAFRAWTVSAASLCVALTASAQQRNPGELYASARQVTPKADYDCKGSAGDYLNAVKYLYAFNKVGEFTGTLAANESFRREITMRLREVEDNATRCLQVERPSAAAFRSDGPVPVYAPPPPPVLPDAPMEALSLSAHSDAEVELWRQRAGQAEAALAEWQQRATAGEQNAQFWMSRAYSVVGSWEVTADNNKSYLSFQSINGRWMCGQIDAQTAKIVEAATECTVRRDPDAVRVFVTEGSRTATFTLQFSGPDQLVGTASDGSSSMSVWFVRKP